MVLFSFAQKNPLVKVYAYSQSLLPGARPENIPMENGGELKVKREEKLNYFFYAEQKRSAKIKITDIWIKGEKFSFRTDSISKTPVEITSGNAEGTSKKIILKPSAGNFFLLITPGAIVKTEKNASGKIGKLLLKNELVLRYQWRENTYYFSVEKIKKLGYTVAM